MVANEKNEKEKKNEQNEKEKKNEKNEKENKIFLFIYCVVMCSTE